MSWLGASQSEYLELKPKPALVPQHWSEVCEPPLAGGHSTLFPPRAPRLLCMYPRTRAQRWSE
eukprot:3477668-Pyramimonas_sp.AAC.1